jgi:hypothetical protein
MLVTGNAVSLARNPQFRGTPDNLSSSLPVKDDATSTRTATMRPWRTDPKAVASGFGSNAGKDQTLASEAKKSYDADDL